MCFRQVARQFKGLFGRLFCFRKSITRRQATVVIRTENRIDLRHSRVRLRIPRIRLDGALEVIQRTVESQRIPATEMKQSTLMQRERDRIFGGASDDGNTYTV